MGCCQVKSSRVETFEQNGDNGPRGRSSRTNNGADRTPVTADSHVLAAADRSSDVDHRGNRNDVDGRHRTASGSVSSSQSSAENSTRRYDSGCSTTSFAPDPNLHHHQQQHQLQHQVTLVDELRGSRREQSASGTSRLPSLGQGTMDADDGGVVSATTAMTTISHHQQRHLRNGPSAGMGIGYSDGRTCGGGTRSGDSELSENRSSSVTASKVFHVSNAVVAEADRPGLRKTQSRLTASQIDFFRMVDEKIASGRDYESSSDGR